MPLFCSRCHTKLQRKPMEALPACIPSQTGAKPAKEEEKTPTESTGSTSKTDPSTQEADKTQLKSALNPAINPNPNSKKPSDKFLVIAKVFQDIEQAANEVEEIIEIGVETLGELSNDVGFIQNLLNHPNVADVQTHTQLSRNQQGQGYAQSHLKFTVKLQKSSA